MSPTHDYVIANGTGSSVRSDINDALAAVVSQNSSSTAPATTYAYMIWVDTTTNIVKMRNGANSAWIELFETDGEFGSKTFNGNITLNAQGDLRFADSDSSNWVAFQAPATVASNVTWTLPSADGTANQTLVTNGSGTLSWATPTSTSDKITEGNTEAEVVDTGSDGHFKVTTEGTERLRVDSSGRLGIGTTSPNYRLHAVNTSAGAITTQLFLQNSSQSNGTGTRIDFSGFDDGTTATGSIENARDSGGLYSLRFKTYQSSANLEAMRIDGSGRLLVGTSSAPTGTNSQYGRLVVSGNIFDGTSTARISLRYGSTAASLGTGGTVGDIFFTDGSGNDYASILAARDTSGTSAGRLVFSTTADGASSPTERMRITNDGNICMPTDYSPGSDSRLNITAKTNNDSTKNVLSCFTQNNTLIFRMRNDGGMVTATDAAQTSGGPYNNTTASAANLFVSSGGLFQRSTSSAKYKTDIEDLQDAYADKILGVRPVWYRSTCANDNPDWGWWGFIAEEVAEIDPRLVHWKTEQTRFDEEKQQSITEKLEAPTPEGVAYDRFVPHLLNLIKRQQQAIETLEAKVAALESA